MTFFKCVIWLLCDMSHSTCATSLVLLRMSHVAHMVRMVWFDLCVTWLILLVRHDSSFLEWVMSHTWYAWYDLICVWHDSFSVRDVTNSVWTSHVARIMRMVWFDQCNTLQLTATTYRNTVQHSATQCNIVQHSATHCNSLQLIATHFNSQQLTATHCNSLQQTMRMCNMTSVQHTTIYCNILQHTATYCNTTHSFTWVTWLIFHTTALRPIDSCVWHDSLQFTATHYTI